MITAMIIPTRGAPTALHGADEFEMPSLEDLQLIVGGYIEYINIPDGSAIVNEEGKQKALGQNFRATAFVKACNEFHDYIVGPCVVVGPPNEDGDSTPIPEHYINLIERL